MKMFRSRHRLHRRLSHLHDWTGMADNVWADRPWRYGGFVRRRRRGPSVARILLAGLAVLAFARLMSSASNQNRSTAQKIALGALLLAAGALLLSLRSSARRSRW